MPYFAAILRLEDAEKNRILRPQHLAFLVEQQKKGKIFARGPFADGAGGLVIYQAESPEEAQRLAQSDPYILGGARSLELHPWEMTVASNPP